MESSRDSSIWRNLAVTFGGGLALGAVGMKITQSALRPLELPPRPDSNPVSDRLTRMERRLERVEQSPAPNTAVAVASAPAQSAAPAPIDQKVLEAVVGAVDARLLEQTGQVERRLADLEAKITVELQSLHHQDRHIADATEKLMAEMRHQFHQEMLDLRTAVQHELGHLEEAVSRTVAQQVAAAGTAHFEAQLAPLRAELAQVDSRIAAATAAQVEQQLIPLRAQISEADARTTALEQSIETRAVTAAATAVAAQFEERLAPLRADVANKERELADLQHRLTESERSVLDVILAIGQVCRQAAERIGVVPPPPAEVPNITVMAAPVEPVVMSEPLEMPAKLEPEIAADPTAEPPLPGFLQQGTGSRPWRVPLVSSFLVTTGSLLLLHYL